MLYPALKRKLRTFDGALEVSALSHQMWACNLVLQYWIGHTKMLPAAVGLMRAGRMCDCAVCVRRSSVQILTLESDPEY